LFRENGGKKVMNTWTVTDSNGTIHNVACSVATGKVKVIIDGEVNRVKSSSRYINCCDYKFNLPGLECHAVAIGKKADLAINGVYKDSGKSYEPVENAPAWIWGLAAIGCVGGFFALGIIGILIEIYMGNLYLRFGIEKKYSMVIKIFALNIVIILVLILVKYYLYKDGILQLYL